ncbi:hypothetical protein T492DRAFT_1147830 [Pavlovales sp. CCMP2436]|nr:hypothetical protein T492DRAFT_1147830 [Pavlovales sp. CCMP2436]
MAGFDSNQPRGLPPRAVDELLSSVSRLGVDSPEVIRLTFKALHDVIRAQGEAIKSLERGNATAVPLSLSPSLSLSLPPSPSLSLSLSLFLSLTADDATRAREPVSPALQL